MKKCSININVIAVLGLMAAISIQLVWLYSSYMFVKSDLTTQATQMLELAVTEETWMRMNQVPLGEYVEGRTEEDQGSNLPEFVYLQASLERLELPISLDTLNVFFLDLLKGQEYPTDVRLFIYKGDTLMQQLGSHDVSLFNICTGKIPLREDSSVTLHAELANPEGLYYKRMGSLFVSTIFLMVFVVGCIILQVQTIRKQKRMAKMREDFSYAMIHDMKMPLSTIAMVLDFWHKGKLEGKAEMKDKYCRIAEDETGRLLSLANRVLTISKLENDKPDMNREWVKLAPLVQKVTERFVAKTEKSVHFDTDLQVEAVYADAGYLEETLSNLIDNSFKYSDEEVHISISAEETGGEYIIRVHDDGWGISQKSQRVIFEKFERGDMLVRKRKKRVSGFGLGLNFVMQVMEAHGGRVTVNSIEGDFTEICVCFPKQETTNVDEE